MQKWNIDIAWFFELLSLQRQWGRNGGKCGICGDPWDGLRENEAGGRYAKGIITRNYTEGQIIDVRPEETISKLSNCLLKANKLP